MKSVKLDSVPAKPKKNGNLPVPCGLCNQIKRSDKMKKHTEWCSKLTRCAICYQREKPSRLAAHERKCMKDAKKITDQRQEPGPEEEAKKEVGSKTLPSVSMALPEHGIVTAAATPTTKYPQRGSNELGNVPMTTETAGKNIQTEITPDDCVPDLLMLPQALLPTPTGTAAQVLLDVVQQDSNQDEPVHQSDSTQGPTPLQQLREELFAMKLSFQAEEKRAHPLVKQLQQWAKRVVLAPSTTREDGVRYLVGPDESFDVQDFVRWSRKCKAFRRGAAGPLGLPLDSDIRLFYIDCSRFRHVDDFRSELLKKLSVVAGIGNLTPLEELLRQELIGLDTITFAVLDGVMENANCGTQLLQVLDRLSYSYSGAFRLLAVTPKKPEMAPRTQLIVFDSDTELTRFEDIMTMLVRSKFKRIRNSKAVVFWDDLLPEPTLHMAAHLSKRNRSRTSMQMLIHEALSRRFLALSTVLDEERVCKRHAVIARYELVAGQHADDQHLYGIQELLIASRAAWNVADYIGKLLGAKPEDDAFEGKALLRGIIGDQSLEWLEELGVGRDALAQQALEALETAGVGYYRKGHFALSMTKAALGAIVQITSQCH